MTDTPDPVRARRRRASRLAALGQRAGYACLLGAVVAFLVGVATGFPPAVTVVVAVTMALATVTLAPAIVLGYAVKAAEREDRNLGR